MNRGQFCHFEVFKHPKEGSCLKFNGYSAGKPVLEYDTCNPIALERQLDYRNSLIE
jgi:hypothetical protein